MTNDRSAARTWWIVFNGIMLGSLLLQGCLNLQAVREFAKTSAATADYQQILADYVRSPDRQKRYQTESHTTQLDTLVKARAEQKAKLEGVQTVLVAYMSALGDLAANDLPNVDKEIGRLGKTLEKAKFVGEGDAGIKKETATAAGTIAKVLTRAVLDHWRKRKVRQIIKDTDDNVQTVVDGLREVVLKDFNLSLDIEAAAIQKYFQKPIADAMSRNEPDAVPPLARILLLERLDQVEMRRAKLIAYADVLSKIGKGHADLRKNVGKLDDKALTQRLKQYGEDLRTLYKTIQQINS